MEERSPEKEEGRGSGCLPLQAAAGHLHHLRVEALHPRAGSSAERDQRMTAMVDRST